MKFPKPSNVILFGGAPLLVEAVRLLQKRKLPFKIYTSPRQETEVLDARGTTLGGFLTKLAAPFVVCEDIDAVAELREEITAQTLGLGIGEAWSFSPRILEAFGGRLVDIRGIPHPRYRGGAHYTWLILRGERHWGVVVQTLNREMSPGEVHSGSVLAKTSYQFPPSLRIPLDYFDYAVKKESQFLGKFLDDVKRGKVFKPVPVREDASLLFPRLNTLKNGWIDWAWSGRDIEKFICAFDSPYAGASTRLNGTRVHIKGARMESNEKAFHPFQSGLIVRIGENGTVYVATTSGLLKVTAVLDEAGKSAWPFLKIGHRFLTPQSELELARSALISYGAT